MKFHINMQSRQSLIIGMLLILVSAISCYKVTYTGQHVAYPPGSKPNGTDWQYTANVTVTSHQFPITAKSKKKVKIKVYDKNDNVFLNENYDFVCATIRANVVWNTFEELNIELLEVGNKYAEDLYNKQLVKDGPNRLTKLKYKFDQEQNKFKQIN